MENLFAILPWAFAVGSLAFAAYRLSKKQHDRKKGESKYEMHPLTLRFYKSPEVERDFLEYYSQRSKRHVRISLLIGLGLYAVFGMVDGWLNQETRVNQWRLVYGAICPFILVTYVFTYSRYFERYMQGTISLMMGLGGVAVVTITALASPPGRHSYYVGLILILMYTYIFVGLRFIYAAVTSVIIIALYEVVAIWVIDIPGPVLLINNYYFLSANIVGMVAGYRIERYVRRTFKERREREVRLMDIFPRAVAEEIINGPDRDVIVDKYEDVTILFADIVNFTEHSSLMLPRALVEHLNEIFSDFDSLAEKHNVAKIKTIGDEYMAAGGLPERQPDHACAVAELALDMQKRISDYKAGRLELRIGINSGPAVAGVIGKRKSSYDVWGNTVNVASRMQSHSEPGKILVSAEAYSKLCDDYVFEERGVVEVKGKGEMRTYFLVGRKA